jgi:hypothetical protein
MGVTDSRVLPLGISKYSRHQFDTAGGRLGVGRWGVWEDEEYGGMKPAGRALAAAAGALMVLGIAACGGDDDDDASADAGGQLDETTTTEDVTTTTLAPEQQVWSDLEAGYQAVASVAGRPDPDAPELAAHFTGESLQGFQDAMRDLQAGGASSTTISLHQYSVAVGGTIAQVDYCFVDTSQHLDATGNPAGAPEVTSMRANAQMEHVDGTWKMSSSTIEPEQCPAS